VKKYRSEANDIYRIRVGNYRVIYVVEDDRLLVMVVRVGHRKDVYR
jgi:mRNA interferase RelE/StbE